MCLFSRSSSRKKMKVLSIFKLLYFLSIMIPVSCEFSTSILTLSRQLQRMDDEIRGVRIDLPRLEKKLVDKLELYESNRKAQVKTYISEIVHEVIGGLVKDKSMEKLLKRHVITEIRDLRMRQHVLKRQQRRMSQEISHLRTVRDIHLQIIHKRLKSVGSHGAVNTSKVQDVERDNSSFRHEVWNEYDTFNQTVRVTFDKINSILNEVNQTLDSRISNLNESLSDLKERRINCSTRLEGIETRFSESVKFLNSSSQKTEKMMESNEALSVRCDAMNQTVRVSLMEIKSTLNEVNKTLDSRISNLNESLSDSKERSFNCSTRLEGIETRFSESVKFLNSSFQKTENILESNEALSVRFDRLNQNMSQILVTLSELANETDHLASPVKTNTIASTKLDEKILNVTTRLATFESRCGRPGKEPNGSHRGQRSRLLMAAYKTQKTKSYQLDLRTNEIMSYPFLQMSGFTALAYDPTHDVILISSNNPEGIYTVDLDGNNMVALKYNLVANGMRIDSSRDQIFLITSRTLCRMNTNGGNFTVIKQFLNESDWRDIEIDTARNVIYIVNSSGMMSLDYTGEFIKWYDNVHYDIALDRERQLIYSVHLGWVKETDLSSGKHTIIWFVGWRQHMRVAYHDNRLYIGLTVNGGFSVIDIAKRSLSNTGRLDFQHDEKKYLLCFIP